MTGTKLLLLANDLGFLESHRRPVVEAALNAGFTVTVCGPERGESEVVRGFLKSGCRFEQVEMSRSGRNPITEYGTYRRIVEVIRAVEPDLVHTVTVKPNLYGGLAASKVSVPALVCSVSGLGHLFLTKGWRADLERRLITFLYRRVSRHPHVRMILQNPDDASLFEQLGIGEAGQLEIIRGSGVDLSKFDYTPEPKGASTVLFAARLLREKGIEEFLAAAEQLISEGINARFIVAGDIDPGNPSSTTREEIESRCSAAGIEWIGHREDMNKVIAESSIVCLPSWREGFPKLLMEAAACGRAVVATDVPGCREAVRHGETGLLVPVRNVEELASAIGELLADHRRRAHFGQRGRIRAEEEFGDQRIAAETLRVYSALVALE